MNLLSLFVSKYTCIAIIIFSLFYSIPLFAAQYTEESSTQEYLFVKGMLRDVSPANQTITIQPKDGPRITVFADVTTEFKGFRKLDELQKRQEIKIWYRQEQRGNIGLKIFKPMELGC